MTTRVNFEIAKALKEKGYNTIDDKAKLASIDVRNNEALFFTYYMCNGDGVTTLEKTATNSSNFNGLLKDYTGTLSEGNLYRWYLAPTIAEVIMWLYDNHDIWITVSHTHMYGFMWEVQGVTNGEYFNPTDCYAAAIEYTLNNLI